MSSDYEFSDDEEFNDYYDDEENMEIEDGIFYPSLNSSTPIAVS
jgi:hypothetical protein